MNLGKTLFSQLMDFLPWKTFGRIVVRHDGDHGARTLSCAELFRILAFAQLTYRESLRDIETCLSVQAGKLYHMGLMQAPARSTLADALSRKVVAVSNLRAMADFGTRELRAPWIDARRGEIYGAVYNAALELVEDEVVAIGRIAARECAAGRALEPAAADANYVRRSDAEQMWKDSR